MKKNRHFVLDANAFISALLLSNTSIAARAYQKAKKEGKIVLSEDTFNEIAEVFIRPKFDRYVPLHKRLLLIEDLRTTTKLIRVTHNIQICRDPKDDKYLELAIAANASIIITGDKDLLVLNPFRNIRILTPSEFLAI